LPFPRQVILADHFHIARITLNALLFLAYQEEVAVLETIGISVDIRAIAALTAL